MSLTLQSHAKINLFLHVLGKRTDGYHEVETLLVPIGLADSLTLNLLDQPKIELTCSDPSLPLDEANLVCRAAKLLQEARPVETPARGAHIHLQKVVPVGAGLGGGSSNGSTTLVGLNRLWNLKFSDEKLEKMAAEFGSDTPFFIRCRPALSQGRGEKLTPFSVPAPGPIFLMNFGFGSSTAWAYRNLEARSQKSEVRREEPAASAQSIFSNPNWPSVLDPRASPKSAAERGQPSVLRNDLEGPVFRKFPILQIAKEFLQAQPEVAGAMMCGSGSTMMAILRSPDKSEALREAVLNRFGRSIWTWIGQTQ